MLPATEKYLRRHILCSAGAPVTAIAQRVLALSNCGLSDPPLEYLATPLPAGSEELPLLAQQMEHACDRLADLELAQRRRSLGYAVAGPDELQVWLLVNLAGNAGEPASPAAGGADPEAFQRCRPVMERTAWRRLRAHLAWHVVLLLEAADQAALVTWVEALRTADAGAFAAGIYLMSPVNAEHLRLAEAAWVEQVAQGVTVLLWSSPPAHSQLERATGGAHSLAAVAASVWCSPAGLLHAWLAAAGAAQFLRTLCDDLQETQRSRPLLLPALEEDLAALRRLCPALPAPQPHPVRPGWGALAALPAAYAIEDSRWRTAAAEQARAARLAWLDNAQETWSRRLQELAADHLLAPAWPQAGPYLAGLLELRRHLDSLAQTVGDRLELIGHQLAQATQDAAAARSSLETICAGFPACSVAGAVQSLLQPWRWPRWVFDYWQRLPDAVQNLLAANATEHRRQVEEATWHTLRQHYLAAAQQTQVQIGRLQQAHQNLASACELAANTSATQAATIPDPWTEPRRAWLLRRLLPERTTAGIGGSLAAALQLELSPTGLLAQLQERIAAATAAVAGWSAMDCLMAAFAGEAATRQDGPALPIRWLAQRLHAAAPLWPAQELAENGLAEEWWSAPEPRGAPEWSTPAYDLAAAWCAHLPQVARARTALDAVQLLHWAEVSIDLEVPIALPFTEEDSSDDNGSLD